MELTLNGILVAVALGGGGYLIAWLSGATSLTKRVNTLNEQLFKANDNILELQRRSFDCEQREGSLRQRIRALEDHAGVSPTLIPAGMIIADLKGVVKAYTPSLMAFLGYEPREVIGRNVDMLMFDEERAQHVVKFQQVVDGSRTIDPMKPITTSVRTKSGTRVSVRITLDGGMIVQEKIIIAIVEKLHEGRSLNESGVGLVAKL